ncbi:MAG: MFS transporter [Paludibacterium sp.]|uniref:MFS transporter n=1 Tax=Paludibacterium sp. TaxID=1917523 RepID=UPI0025F40428|nr:MFS transporter [Paludibacterium sp.]MBV8049027.1 MFS transporter [Paludibacterium sp.]MBV8646058.1 MFS transporter [Paludibacterium sp.]
MAATLRTTWRQLIEPYRGLPRSVYIQLVCSLVNNMGGMAKLFLPLYLHADYGVSYRWVGTMVSAYGFGCLIGAYGGGSLSDRYDSRRLSKLFLAGSALSLLVLATRIPLWLFAPVLLVSGFCDGAFRPVNQRLTMEPCPPARRPQAQGMLRVAINLGVALSGVTGGFLASLGFQWVYLSNGIATGIAGIWLALAYRRVPVVLERRHSEDPGASLAHLSPWRDIPYLRLMCGMVVAAAVFDQLYSVVGLYLAEYNHLGPSWLGVLFSINGLMVVFLQVPIAHRMYHWGVGRCAQWGVILTGLSYLLLLVGPQPIWPILMVIAQTTSELLISPAFIQLVMRRSEGRLRGSYMGLYSAAWAGRTLFAPALGAWIYGTAGGTTLWVGCALATLVAALIQMTPVRIILDQAPPSAMPLQARKAEMRR